MNPWVNIPSAPHLEKTIAEDIRSILLENKQDPHKGQNSQLPMADRLRLQILHRQFSKGGLFGLPAAVWVARKVVTVWRSASRKERADS